MTQEINLMELLTRLCARYNAVDLEALKQTDAFKEAYARESSATPHAGAQSNMGKALRAMAFIEKKGVDIQAHCIDPAYVNVKFDKQANQRAIDSLGVLLAMPDGNRRFVFFADFDEKQPLENQFPAGGFVPGLLRGMPVTLRNVSTSENLTDGTTTVKISKKDSTIQVGGHTLPFPEGPDLEDQIGATAVKNGWGAYRVQKKQGTIRGRFGDDDFDPVPGVFTVTDNTKAIRVQDFTEDFDGNEVTPDEFIVQAECSDRKGNKVNIKFPLFGACDQLGIPRSASRELIIARLAGQRVLARGQGSIFAGKRPTDFGPAGKLFYDAVAELEAAGAIEGTRTGGKRLNLNKIPMVDDSGRTVPRTSLRIGDKDVYDIVFKPRTGGKEGEGEWEISTLWADEKKNPWFSVVPGAKPRGTRPAFNAGAFYQFLSVSATGELAADDPFMQLARQTMLPTA